MAVGVEIMLSESMSFFVKLTRRQHALSLSLAAPCANWLADQISPRAVQWGAPLSSDDASPLLNLLSRLSLFLPKWSMADWHTQGE
jgi:hypothetical protein